MIERLFYKISGFSPTENSMGQFGFAVKMEKGLALQALKRQLPERGYKHLQETARLMLTRTGLAKQDDRFVKPVYRFIEMPDKDLSCLLQGCEVPGDACSLSVDWSQIERLRENPKFIDHLDYTTHNVDSSKQAYALLSAWLLWADIIEANV